MSKIKKISRWSFTVGSLFFLYACTGGLLQGNKTTITSMPSGADVHARGERIGKTPLEIRPNEAFPPSWSHGAFQASGLLKLTYPGCEDYKIHVNDSLLSGNIHVKLKCDGLPPKQIQKKMENRSPVVKSQSIPAKVSEPKKKSEDVEGRLKKVEQLYKKGIITKEEYKKTRSRILNDL